MRFKPVPPLEGVECLGENVDIGHPLLRIDHAALSSQEEVRSAEIVLPWLNPRLEKVVALSSEALEQWGNRLQSMKGATTRRLTLLRDFCIPSPSA